MSDLIPAGLFYVKDKEISLTPPLPSQSCFKYQIDAGGLGKIPAKLTYDLLSNGSKRTILLVESRFASAVWNLKTDSGYQELVRRVREKEIQRIGNISIAKGIVQDIHDTGDEIPNLIIGAHRFGAVPVAVLPGSYRLEDQTAIQVAIYESLSKGGDCIPGATKKDLLKSYSNKLDLLLRCYLEEVAEEFHDIEVFSTRIETFRRLKDVEDILAASVDSKITDIVTHAESKKDKELYDLARLVWERFDLSILVAAHARVFALYFVNELYRFLGIEDRTKKYYHRWQEDSKFFRQMYGPKHYDTLVEAGANSSLYFLRETLRRYWAGDEIDELISETTEGWLSQFLCFARFVNSIRREFKSSRIPSIFLSAQHRVPAVNRFAEAMEKYLAGRCDPSGSPMAQLLRVSDEKGGSNIGRMVMNRIWQSNAVLAAIPKQWSETEDGKGNLKWVAKEIDHGLLTKRKVSIFMEEGIDRKDVRLQFQQEIEHLASAEGRISKDARKKVLVEQIDNIVNASFRYSDKGGLDGNARDGLDEAVAKARETLGRELVLGFLSQFPEDDEMTIARVLYLLTKPLKKSEIARKLSVMTKSEATLFPELSSPKEINVAKKAFDKAWVKARKRTICLDGESFPLIVRIGQSYRGNLRGVLKCIRPELSVQEVETWHLGILRRLLGPEIGQT